MKSFLRKEKQKHFPEDKKQSLVEYRKKYHKILKNGTTSQLKTD